MNLFLIRHAHALGADEDPARPLSPRGREQVLSLAEFLERSGVFQPAEFWHSALVRSRQTAELLARRLRLAAPLALIPDLEPEASPKTVVRRIRAATHAIAVVGHEPHLSALATLLVAGKAEPPAFVMKKCSALALEGIDAFWSVRWHVSPDLIV
ncbi:MAG: SixA phosphatase family protein [Opitutaceae bacterium]